jgi:ABC-2 type transport system permease protein/lipopolysaccharide transport system permease protein
VPARPPDTIRRVTIRGSMTAQTSADQRELVLNPRATFADALDDIVRGLRSWRAWLLLAWFEIKHSYRGSVLGPFWITITMGVFVFAVGLLYSQVFGADADDYIPWLACGFVIWTMISGLINDGAKVYVSSSSFSTEMRLPYSFFSLKLAAKHLITFLHHIVVIVAVAAIFGLPLGVEILLFVPGLAIILFCGVWVSVILGLISVRFRDIPNIIASLVQVSFFLTPIIWQPAQVQDRMFVVLWNPFYHFLELVRAPLLGSPPTLTNYAVTLGCSAIAAGLALLLFARYRNRIPYWI